MYMRLGVSYYYPSKFPQAVQISSSSSTEPFLEDEDEDDLVAASRTPPRWVHMRVTTRRLRVALGARQTV